MLVTLTAGIGMHPVHAGVMIILALNISLMTPPVGACLFVLCSITGESLEGISKAIWPFILVEVGVLVIVTYWTELTMFLPKLLLGM
jgi:TRAP-type C4-dicarboxylate transport system permease large subunit